MEPNVMIQTPPDLKMLTSELTSSTWTLTTIAVLFESGLAAQLSEPKTAEELASRCPSMPASRIERCLALAMASGVVVAEGPKYRLAPGAIPFAQPPMRASLQGDLRSTLMQAVAFLDAATAGPAKDGWHHTSRALLQAQGDASTMLPPMLKMNLLAQMGDLGDRLEQPEARFLDVGTGVGGLAIAMCRLFPHVRVVGVDMYDVPLGIARENVAAAGLGERIELRQQRIEELRDESAFDLAWLPTFFVPERALAAATAHVRAALRPGGWLLFPISACPAGTDAQRAMIALLTDMWGGTVLSVERAEAVLKEAGFTELKPILGPPFAPALMVAKR